MDLAKKEKLLDLILPADILHWLLTFFSFQAKFFHFKNLHRNQYSCTWLIILRVIKQIHVLATVNNGQTLGVLSLPLFSSLKLYRNTGRNN